MSSVRDQLAKAKSKLATPKEKTEDHPANLNNHQDGSFYNVEIDLIVPDPNQPRKFFNPDSLEELSQSIKQKGVLQPVIIRKDQEGKIYLVAGERRYRAAKMAGLNKIPAILTNDNPVEIAIIENLQRDDLKPIEEAEALNRMLLEYNYTQEQLVLIIGKAKSTISEILSLNRLPEIIKEEVRRAEQYSRRLLIEIAKQETPESMIGLFNQVKENNLKSGDVRKITRKQEEKKQQTPAAIALNKTIALSKHLAKLDFSSIEENEKMNLKAELEDLRTSLNKILD